MRPRIGNNEEATALHAKIDVSLRAQLRRLASLEYSVIEACHDGAYSAWDPKQALLAGRTTAAEAHLLSLGDALRELGDQSLSYSRCMRSALLRVETLKALLWRLELAYQRVLNRRDLPESLRIRLASHVAEHRRLHDDEAQRMSWAA